MPKRVNRNLAVGFLVLGILFALPVAAAARAVPDVILGPAPPPPPPPEIRQVAPPVEIRQMAPPEDMRHVAPPPPAGGASSGTQPSQAGPATKAGDPIPLPYPAGLAVASLGLSNSTPKTGERVFATATLKNSGTQSLAGVRVRFFLGKIQVGDKVVTVPANGSATASVSFVAAPTGAQNLKVQADPGAGLAAVALARGLTVTGAAKTDVEDFTTPAKKGTTTAATGATGGQAPLSPQQIPFDKPLLAKKGTEIARQPGGGAGSVNGTGSPGSPPGSHLTGLDDPTGGLGDKNKPQGLPDTTPWGSTRLGKADLGDGLMGKDDQGDMPPTNLGEGIPQKPTFPTSVGPHKGGPDAGYYGGGQPQI